mmetsp:Transcript_93289/g.165059  ORF Transcript_93289/g.165059 Transcript_93289/m.165059 type:complete len:125 (+) Transcript_93289:71-445(+)
MMKIGLISLLASLLAGECILLRNSSSTAEARNLISLGRACAKFHHSKAEACSACQDAAEANGATKCQCQVGDCSSYMRANTECGNGRLYYCAVCAPVSFPVKGGDKITTTDYAKLEGWLDVGLC